MVLKGQAILVTGGAGFVGSHIVDKALEAGARKVIVVDNYLRGSPANLFHLAKGKRLEVVKGDIRDVGLIRRLTKGLDYICHQAAVRLTQCAKEPRLCHEVMVDGTFNILEAAVANKVKRVVMASSVSVYGEPSYVPMDEGHPYNNTTLYGAAKIANEHLALAFHTMFAMPIIIFRYFNVYGPRMDVFGAYTEVLIKWLDAIDKGESPIVHGNGKQALDFVYVEDVARANILALTTKIPFGIYNVGTGKQTSLKDLVEILIRLNQTNVKPIFSKTQRPFVQRRQEDTTRARRELGFVAKTSPEAGLKKLIEWRKERLKLHSL